MFSAYFFCSSLSILDVFLVLVERSPPQTCPETDIQTIMILFYESILTSDMDLICKAVPLKCCFDRWFPHSLLFHGVQIENILRWEKETQNIFSQWSSIFYLIDSTAVS